MAARNEKEMPFLDHLEELRTRLLKSIAAVLMASVACYFLSEHILNFVTKPFPGKLIYLSVTEGLMVRIKLSLFAGIIVSLPVIFYQIWQFVVPGLFERERKYVIRVTLFSTACFLVGAAFAFFLVIPYGIKFLLGFQTAKLIANVTINEYLGFVSMLVLAFGVVFELPILSFFLTKIGLLTPPFLRHYRRHAYVLIVILAAVLTPQPDVFSQLMLAVPLMVLYEISIYVSKFSLPKRHAGE